MTDEEVNTEGEVDGFSKFTKRTRKLADDIIEEKKEESKGKVDVAPVKEVPDIPDIAPAKPTIAPNDRVVPVYELPGLNDDEKMLIVKSRIGKIISMSKTPCIPTLLKCRHPSSNIPTNVLIELDYMLVKEAWEFYSTNVAEPRSEQFIEILRETSKRPERVFQTVVEMKIL